MRQSQLICLVGALMLCGACATVDNSTPDRTGSGPVLRHVVLFDWKDGTTPEKIRGLELEFCALPGKIDTICGFEWGTNVSAQEKTEGYTHCFIVTFRDQAGLDAYLPHTAHQAYVKLLGPHLDKALVVDYWTKP